MVINVHKPNIVALIPARSGFLRVPGKNIRYLSGHPLIPFGPKDQPWHSSQYQTLPEIYVQNASLEIAWTKVVTDTKTIAGNIVIPFFTVDDEGLDINGEYDWKIINTMLEEGQATLPSIDLKPYSGN
jgi:CMP-N,N'-diacetyllegionaminic acid synthase